MPRSNASKQIMPRGYKFVSKHQMVSEAAYKRTMDLFEQADNRNPEMHDMYVYNDFAAYGCLDLIDKELSAIKTKVTKKEWEKAWILIEALTYFMEQESDIFMGADDGERVTATMQAYSVLLVTICKNHPNFDLEHIPNLRHFLRVAVSLGEDMNNYGDPISNYPALLRRYARALGPTDKEREAAMLAEWKASLSREEREDIEAAEQEDAEDEGSDEDEDDDPDAWMKERKGDKNVKENAREFALASAWKEYEDCVKGSGSIPFRGPPEWDVTKWSKSDRRQFDIRG